MELLGTQLGRREEGLPAQAQAGERHHLGGWGALLSSTDPEPKTPDPNPGQPRGEGATTWGFTLRKTVTQEENSAQNHP